LDLYSNYGPGLSSLLNAIGLAKPPSGVRRNYYGAAITSALYEATTALEQCTTYNTVGLPQNSTNSTFINTQAITTV